MPNDKVRVLPRRMGDGFSEVVIRVSDDVMAKAWSDLEGPMKDGPDYINMDPDFSDEEWIFSEEELKQLVGAFVATSMYLPMAPYEYFRWVERADREITMGEHLDDFVATRAVGDTSWMRFAPSDQLEALAERIPAFIAECAMHREEQESKAREAKRHKCPAAGSRQAMIEDALAGASIGEVWNAVANAFEGDTLNEIGDNLYHHVENVRELAAAVEAA